MGLQDKYARLIALAQSGVQNLNVVEKENVLYISGSSFVSVKNNIWSLYEQIDPEMRAGDLVLKIDVIPGGEEIYEIKSGDSLSKIAAKYPNMTWQKIAEANKETIKNPDMIHPGQKIIIPL